MVTGRRTRSHRVSCTERPVRRRRGRGREESKSGGVRGDSCSALLKTEAECSGAWFKCQFSCMGSRIRTVYETISLFFIILSHHQRIFAPKWLPVERVRMMHPQCWWSEEEMSADKKRGQWTQVSQWNICTANPCTKCRVHRGRRPLRLGGGERVPLDCG